MDQYQKLFGTSGIRRKISEFPENFFLNLGKAIGTYSRDSKIAVARDTRESSEILENELCKGITSTGKDVVLLGIATTPTLALAARDFGTGIMITASHNPEEYNGFKFYSKEGAYSKEQESDIEKIFFLKQFEKREKGKIEKVDYTEKHISFILKKIGRLKDKLRVFIDCANGSGSVITPKLLTELGCDVTAVNTSLNGKFPHDLEPTEKNLKEILKQVKKADVDIGFVHDGDADRTAAISKDGKLIPWDTLLAILSYGKKKVVTTVDASMRIEEVCNYVIRVAVGDVAVANAVLKEKADFGGEPSGAFIFPEFHCVPDGPLTAAIISKLIDQEKFYEILSKIGDYPMERIKIPVLEKEKQEIMQKIRILAKKEFQDVSFIDGVRVSLENGWFLIRPSGTEKVIRITAEGKNRSHLRQIIKKAKDLIENSKK
ncbi:MAG: phosphopentomutase/phosphoglucosamine mutase [Candidatus Altiarchaeota archaeon]